MHVNGGPMVEISEARGADWPQIWAIIGDVVRAQETFPYDPDMTEATARSMWMVPAPARVTVATRDGGARVLGTANMYANRGGPGDHVASGSLMVAEDARGMGAGRALVEDMIAWAREMGYAAIQFNAVVESNTPAVRLYESLGFVTLGTAPGAFRHPALGPTGLKIMWLDLRV